ncbi:hypothetical protein MRB53_000682 [Persea americana]|uniref:Uncharacterized protein n=1 Tax=Persea americana TaxID=3435 RepID=A0ACC2MPR1_PERAE|nr:hypothetical protein MRB53_000682 [Persea americana]
MGSFIYANEEIESVECKVKHFMETIISSQGGEFKGGAVLVWGVTKDTINEVLEEIEDGFFIYWILALDIEFECMGSPKIDRSVEICKNCEGDGWVEVLEALDDE